MNRTFRNRRALGVIITTLMILVVTVALGIAVLAYSQGKMSTFKSTVETIYGSALNTVQPSTSSLVVENIVYHSSSQQLNFTLSNTGTSSINITKIIIQTQTTPSFNVTATVSSTSPVSMTTMPTSLSTNSETVTVPGTFISPGQVYTIAVPYHCICDPITITATTSDGTVIQKNIPPNVGWYSSLEQYRKRITVNMPQIVGNPSPIILDNSKSITSTGTNSITLSGFTVNPGNNRLLVVGVGSLGTVSSITFGGTPLIKANATANGGVDSELWYLTNPSSGTKSIVVTMSGSVNTVVGAYSFFGVDQTTPIAEGNKNNLAAVTSISTAFSTTYTNSWIVDSIAGYPTDTALAIGIASPKAKKAIYEKLKDKGFYFPSFIAGNAWLSNKVETGQGVILYPGVSINYETVVEDFVIMNMN